MGWRCDAFLGSESAKRCLEREPSRRTARHAVAEEVVFLHIKIGEAGSTGDIVLASAIVKCVSRWLVKQPTDVASCTQISQQ